jgi:ABC-2 type transport system ATP-binding protein
MSVILNARNLEKTFHGRGKSVRAVQDVSLQLYEGEVLAFLGPNGAGKTTTIKMIAGLILPDAGTVEIVGMNPHHNPRAMQQLGAVLEGSRNLYWKLTPEENIEYFGVLRGLTRRTARIRGKQLLERFELSHKGKTPVQELSRGMQQKVAIAVALVHRPRVLLLDEPTLGLDVEASEVVKEIVTNIAQEGCGVLLTTHQLEIAEELSQRVMIIQQGQILVEEPTTKLIQQFSGTAYAIELSESLDSDRQSKVALMGGVVEDRIIFVHETETLYAVLSILEPLPLLRINKERSRLSDIFLQLIREGREGSG